MSEQVKNMFASISDVYDKMNTTLSFGTHHFWRRKTVRASKVKKGMKVLDCATGTGDLAHRYKKAVGKRGEVVGTDFVPEMVSLAQKKYKDIYFETADVMHLPYDDNSFDVSSISFGIRNVDDPVKGLSEMARVVKPGGKVVVLEFGQPKGFFGKIYSLYSEKIMPLIGKLVAKDEEAYRYLHETSSTFPCREDFLNMMYKTEKLSYCTFKPVSFGIAYIYVGTAR